MEDDPQILKNKRYLLNDETEEAIMRDMMKKSTEMFGARKSVSSLFINRRSTIKKQPPKVVVEEEKKDSVADKKDNLEVVDIQDDMKDILGKKPPAGKPQEKSSESTLKPEKFVLGREQV